LKSTSVTDATVWYTGVYYDSKSAKVAVTMPTYASHFSSFDKKSHYVLHFTYRPPKQTD